MKSALIGYTGFVGQNLINCFDFDDLYNSKNITDIAGKTYDLVICAGVPAQMNLANKFPEQDWANIELLVDQIKKASIKQFILISSTAVYKQDLNGVDETNTTSFETSIPYGYHRRKLEELINSTYADSIILRLPALFGLGLKKNFLFDLLNPEPAFMNTVKYDALLAQLDHQEAELIKTAYQADPSKGVYNYVFYNEPNVRGIIQEILKKYKQTSLNFTHPNSCYQFYNVANLWRDINIAQKENIQVLNICSAPIEARLIAEKFFGLKMENMGAPLFKHDMQSIYSRFWSQSQAPYLYSEESIWSELAVFFDRYRAEARR